MTTERLNELKKGLMNMLFICLAKLTDKDARENVKADTAQILLILDAELARQSVTGEEIQAAIAELSDISDRAMDLQDGNHVKYMVGLGTINVILAALKAYGGVKKPTEIGKYRVKEMRSKHLMGKCTCGKWVAEEW